MTPESQARTPAHGQPGDKPHPRRAEEHEHHDQARGHRHHEGAHPSPTAPNPRRWFILTLMCMAQFMLIVDVTVVNVALPSIGDDLALSPAATTWVVTAYTLLFGSLLLLGGRLGDFLGRRRTFLGGLALFTAASLVSGLAETSGVLIAARAAQGVGAAFLSPAAMAMVMATFQGPERHRALGVWAAIGGTGAAFGVLLGGVLTSGPGWEWAFLVNVPIGLMVLFLVPVLVREDGPTTGPGGRHKGVDLPGALTMTAMPALLIYGLVQARDHGFGDAFAWGPLLASALCAALFVRAERAAVSPLVRLPFLARRSMAGGCLLMLASAGVLISGFFLCSLHLQHVLGHSALRTGLMFLPAALATTVGAHLASRAVPRIGWRPTSASGLVLAAVGALLLSGVDRGNAWTEVLPGFVLLSFGLGIGFVCAITSAMHGVGHLDAGLGSGLVNTAHELGASLGIAVVTAVAGTSLEGAAGTPSLDGLGNAFVTCAVISAVAAVGGLMLLPKERPDPSAGPVMAH
ncbi:MFS transporter [Streptomyces lancefieldiae]|uniref:MFS transporter n=1 Tax=Streptomyces lancefieldiae TaxID=3075520 RepID=A0ABU3AV39_9ACTN|nr:MFS transporter [Streptomyces sp. DSM 40712]MDT0614059.1 MFS transporter [Streptomyces sp. DSM 40712]